MKFSATTVLLAAAIGASAHPSGHAHRHMHRSIEERDFIIANKPAPPPPPPAPTTTSAAPPPPPPSAPAAPASSAAPSGGSSTPGQFCGGAPSRKRATAAEISYQGNIGAPGNYGCNIMLVDSPDGYDYTMEMINSSGEDQQGTCWLKIGPTGQVNGFFKGNSVLTFDLPAGATKYLAAEANTQMGCTYGPGSVPLTSFGQFAGTWVEADFANEQNNQWSGFDASSLVPAQYDMTIAGLQVCGSGTCSTINPGGSGTNAFTAGTAADDGIGGNIVPGPLHLTVKVGYSG